MIMQTTPAAIKDRPAPLNLIVLPFADPYLLTLGKLVLRIVTTLIRAVVSPSRR